MKWLSVAGAVGCVALGSGELGRGAISAWDVIALTVGLAAIASWILQPALAPVLAGAAFALSAVEGDVSVVLVLVTVASIAVASARVSLRATAIGVAVVIAAMAVAARLDDSVSLAAMVQPAALVVVVATAAHVVRRRLTARVERERMRTALDLAKARADLARDVHDVTSHALMAVLTQIRVGRRGFETGNAESTARGLDRAENAAKDAIGDLRSLTMIIAGEERPLSTCRTVGDVADQIEEVCRNFPFSSFEFSGDAAAIDPAVGTTAIRVVQQCLANASAHSPNASVRVTMGVDGELLRLTSTNGLDGSDAAGLRLGLKIMEHRVGDVGGEFSATRAENDFVVTCCLPLATAR